MVSVASCVFLVECLCGECGVVHVRVLHTLIHFCCSLFSPRAFVSNQQRALDQREVDILKIKSGLKQRKEKKKLYLG